MIDEGEKKLVFWRLGADSEGKEGGPEEALVPLLVVVVDGDGGSHACQACLKD